MGCKAVGRTQGGARLWTKRKAVILQSSVLAHCLDLSVCHVNARSSTIKMADSVTTIAVDGRHGSDVARSRPLRDDPSMALVRVSFASLLLGITSDTIPDRSGYLAIEMVWTEQMLHRLSTAVRVDSWPSSFLNL